MYNYGWDSGAVSGIGNVELFPHLWQQFYATVCHYVNGLRISYIVLVWGPPHVYVFTMMLDAPKTVLMQQSRVLIAFYFCTECWDACVVLFKSIIIIIIIQYEMAFYEMCARANKRVNLWKKNTPNPKKIATKGFSMVFGSICHQE